MSKKVKSSLPTIKKTRAPKTAPTHPTHEEIAFRAYEIYLERAGAPGDASQDWTRAERELLEKYRKQSGKMGPTLVAA